MRTVISLVLAAALSTLASAAASTLDLVHGVSVEEMNNHLVFLYDHTPKVDGDVSKPADFTWKDPAAALRVGKSLPEYLTGCLDPSFRHRLYSMLMAAEAAGFEVGITSLCRDDWRQSKAEGKMKAATCWSYHGGSCHGGVGMAADIVSLGPSRIEQLKQNGILYAWIDAHDDAFGLVRVYGDRDAGHVGPRDGPESRHYMARIMSAAKQRLARAMHRARHTKIARHHSKKHVHMAKASKHKQKNRKKVA